MKVLLIKPLYSHNKIKNILLAYIFIVLFLASFGINAYAEYGLEDTNPMLPANDPNYTQTQNFVDDVAQFIHFLKHEDLTEGDTLYLGEGTFRIYKEIYRQNDDPAGNLNPFNGIIKGKGKDKTFIKAVRGKNCTPFTNKDGNDVFSTGRGPAMFSFRNASFVGVEDLTFISDPSICNEWVYDEDLPIPKTRGISNYILIQNGHHALEDDEEPLNTSLKNVDFIGSRKGMIVRPTISSQPNFGSPSAANNLLDSPCQQLPTLNFQPPTDLGTPEIVHLFEIINAGPGQHIVESCSFSNGFDGMYEFWFCISPTINFGSPGKVVEFTNGLANSIELLMCKDVTATVMNVKSIDATGLYYLGNENENSNITIEGCDINLRSNTQFPGIQIIAGPPGDGEVKAVIRNNNLYNYNPPSINEVVGTIYTSNVNEVDIRDNTIKGKGPYAIFMTFQSKPDRLVIHENHLDEWDNATPYPTPDFFLFGPFAPKIMIGFKDNLNYYIPHWPWSWPPWR